MWRHLAVSLTISLFLGTKVQRSQADTDYGTGLTSTAEGNIRLVNGHHSWKGRVEIYLSGQWGTVCDDHWDKKDAEVVCRQLGLDTHHAQAFHKSYFGEGSGPIHLDDVHCNDDEARLTDCAAKPVGDNDCDHNEAAGVSCAPIEVSCDFENGDLCDWMSGKTYPYNLQWTATGRYVRNNFAQLDVSGQSAGSSGVLYSPWLDARPGYSCYLTFAYSIHSSDRCRLTLFQENATNHRRQLWNTTQASTFSTKWSTPVECSKERYRIFFIGERLGDGDCDTSYRKSSNAIYIDNIVFKTKLDPSTTSNTPTSTPTTPTYSPTTTTTTTTTTSTTAEQVTPAPTVGSSGRTDASSGTTVTGSKVDNKALTEDETGGLDLGVIVVIVVIVVVLIVVAVVIVVVICRRKGGGVKGQGRMTGCFKGVRNRPAASEGHATGAVTNRAYVDVDEHFQGAAANTEGDNSVYRNVPQNLCRNSNSSHAPEAAMDVRNSDHRHTGNNLPPTRPHPKATHAGTSQSRSPDEDTSYNHLNTRPVTTDDSNYNHLNTRPVTADDSNYNHLNTRPANARSATPSVPTTDDTYDHASDPHDHQAEDRNHTTRGVQRDSEEYTLTDTTHRNLPAPRAADSSIYEVEEDDDPLPSVSEDAYNHTGVTGGSARTPAAPLDDQETYNHLNANQETYSNLQHNDGMRQDAQRAASSDQYSHI